MAYKRYTLALLAIFLPVLTVVPVINWIVDPFWYFRNIEVRGFNMIKPSYHLYERQVKSALVSKLHPEAVILGSSFAEIGLPVTHAGFTNGGQLKSYNLSLPWAHGEELYCYALFALAQPGVKRLVLGGFNPEAAPCTKYQNLGEADYAKLLLGKTAFRATLETLRHQDVRQESTADGMWSYQRYRDVFRNDGDIMANFADSFRGKLCQSPQPNRKLNYGLIDHSKPPRDASTAGMRNIIRLALKNNIQLILIDFPKHVFFYEQERECGRTEADWSALWRIASIVEEEAAPGSRQVELWTFYGYQEINGEKIYAGTAMADRLWQDDGHFNPEVGMVAFDAIFGSNHTFGHKVTTRDFDRILAEGESQRRAFLTRNSWVREELDELRQAASLRKSVPLAKP
jgi:hypothetical protein